jgi:protein-tyrosine kinase
MSIVERSLQKLHAAQAAAKTEAAAPAPAPGTPGSSGIAGAGHDIATGRMPALFVPHQRVAIDEAHVLRSIGLQSGVPARRTTDEFRRIKWPILAAAFGKDSERVPNGPLVLVTSTLPGEGKTFVSLNLALNVAAERDCRVLLVDADLAKAHVSLLLGLQDRRGLTDVLTGAVDNVEDLILATDVEGLSVLPAGTPNSEAPELLASRRMRRLLEWLSAHCPDSIILIDSSPLLATNEAQVLSGLVGHVLMVVRAESTPQSMVMDALGLLGKDARVSCVLNQAVLHGMSQYYGTYEANARGHEKR